MPSVALEPASGRSHAELAALFTAGYEGYYMPVSVDESTFSFMAGTWDYDLDASLVAHDEGDDVGLCMLAVRGGDAWIGGVGVVAGRRSEGIGEQQVLAAAVADVLGRVAERLPWQRSDASVANLADAHALASDRGSLVYRAAAGVASLLQVAADDDGAVRELLRSLPEPTTGLRYLNGPRETPRMPCSSRSARRRWRASTRCCSSSSRSGSRCGSRPGPPSARSRG